MVAKLDKRDIRQRVSDWVSRLTKLYAQLDVWLRDVPGAQVLRGDVEQINEEVMQQFGVRPQQVPTYTVVKGKRRVSFVPSSLWIIRANGRVNITTNKNQYMLLDMGGADGQPSDWQLVTWSLKRPTAPFDRERFLALVERDI
ncbi:MAG: hypothetical protein NTW87_27065 [Planctomycetota bacterium]|nr:hypothetical protein [Planctomycetota bacterium]